MELLQLRDKELRVSGGREFQSLGAMTEKVKDAKMDLVSLERPLLRPLTKARIHK